MWITLFGDKQPDKSINIAVQNLFFFLICVMLKRLGGNILVVQDLGSFDTRVTEEIAHQ